MMTKAMNRALACSCATAVLLLLAPTGWAQQSAQNQNQAATSSTLVPKDARTRAKAHTELGALYFQSGNLIVALEELTLAAAIDPEYATAFSTRALVLYHVKEYESAEKDFSGRSVSMAEIQRSTTTMDGISAKPGRLTKPFLTSNALTETPCIRRLRLPISTKVPAT
jgi:hypothetical protein